LAPIIRGRKGEYREIFQEAQRDGFVGCEWTDKFMSWIKPSLSTRIKAQY
jgi:excinuclease UvrABC ATPase subunit